MLLEKTQKQWIPHVMSIRNLFILRATNVKSENEGIYSHTQKKKNRK